MRTQLVGGVVVLAAVCGLSSCKKAPAAAAAPMVGWQQLEGWRGECYFAPDFANMGLGDKRMARNEALDAMMSQWSGDHGGPEIDPVVIENVETVLLGQPEKIESVVVQNNAQCAAMMSGKSSASAWTSWLTGLPGVLLEGECTRPLDVTIFDYLDLGLGWQFTQDLCEDDVIRITATASDKYRVNDKGPWINAAGDLESPATSEYPCNTENCYVGQLVLRFRGESGTELIVPVGLETIFDPPEHGTISIRVNDTEFFDNEYKIERGIQYHTGVTYTPVDG